MLGFDYDSSWPDTDPFEPQDGGCCTWLPFFNGELVELPLTLPQDHTLFVILGHQDEAAWVEKTEFLRARGGMAMIDTHPDYLVDERIFTAYARFLDRFADDATAWKALPREISAWWRRRAASSLERDGRRWRIVGPAADEGRVEFEGAKLVTATAGDARRGRHRRRLPGARDRPKPRSPWRRRRRARRRAFDQPPFPVRRRLIRFRDLRDDEQTVGALLASLSAATSEGWVVFPTREETVAALSRHRAELLEHFRIPTPEWAVTRWAWDKRNTYVRAAGARDPGAAYVARLERGGADAVDGEPPYVIKPAIKEHFFYATKCKAWRADIREELVCASARRRSSSAPRRSSSRS